MTEFRETKDLKDNPNVSIVHGKYLQHSYFARLVLLPQNV